jgi:hypothetical protein
LTNSGAKCTTAMLRFCWIDELVKMIAYKGLHFGVRHLRLGIHGFWVGGRCLPEHGQGWPGRQSPQPQSSPRRGLWRLLPCERCKGRAGAPLCNNSCNAEPPTFPEAPVTRITASHRGGIQSSSM